MKRVIYALLLIVFFVGCVDKKPPIYTKSYHATLISPMIKISDVAFLHVHDKFLNMQIYSFGVNTADIKISKNICLNQSCLNQSKFNERFFLARHYDGLLAEILTAKPIFDKDSLIKTQCGFNQNIKKNFIEYEICAGNIKFIDTKNKIKIVLKEL